MWTKVQQFRENRKHRQNLTFHNFLVFELWLTIFWGLVVLLEDFATIPKYVDQSSAILRKSGPNFKNWSLNNYFVSELWPTKFGLETLLVLPSKCAKLYVKIPSRFRDIKHFWCSDLAKLQANATFGKTMEQLRNRRNIHLRPEITPSAKFLALSIIPVDSDHAECGGIFRQHILFGF